MECASLVTQPTKVAGKLRLAVRNPALLGLLVDGTWNVPTTLAVSLADIAKFLGTVLR